MSKDRLTIDQLTTRELGFVSDPELALIIEDLLDEIDRVFSVSGFRSALYLSMSAVEGILKHALKLNSKKALQTPAYLKIKSKNPKKKKIKDLDLFDCIPICSELSLIPKDLETTYNQLREFRNYIHPERELSSAYKINIGISELGIGILNTTLLHFDKLRFIEGGTWKVISGNPQYTLSNRQLSLMKHQTPTDSFLITEGFINQDFTLEFDVNVPEGSILNFVYNFSAEDNYNMIRIDKRRSPDKTKPRDDGLFICPDKFHWPKRSNFKSSPDINRNSHNISIKASGKSLEFIVDGSELKPKKGAWNYDPCKSIGFFNQLQRVKIENFKITL